MATNVDSTLRKRVADIADEMQATKRFFDQRHAPSTPQRQGFPVSIQLQLPDAVVETLTAQQMMPCNMLHDFAAISGGVITDVVSIPCGVVDADSLRLLCVYLREQPTIAFQIAFFAPLVASVPAFMRFMKTVSFFQCVDLLKTTQTLFVKSYLVGKTPNECLQAMGLPRDTVFSADEYANVKHTYPFLRLDYFKNTTAQ